MWDCSCTTAGLVAVLTALVTYYFYNLRFNDYWRIHGVVHIPRVPTLYALFVFLNGKKSIQDIEQERYLKYGKIFGTHEFSTPMLYLSEPEYVKQILIKDFHVFPYRRSMVTNDKVSDSFLATIRGDGWKRLRTIVSPMFTPAKMKAMLPNMRVCANQSVENFLKSGDTSDSVDCKKLFSNYALDVIGSAVLGIRVDSHNEPDHAFVANANKIFSNMSIGLRMITFFFWPSLARALGLKFQNFAYYEDLIKNIIETRKQSKEVVHNDFVQLMLEHVDDEKVAQYKKSMMNGTLEGEKQTLKYMSTNELIGQCITFFMAGYELTVNSALNMVCYNLALNQEEQKKAQQEVDQIWQKHSVIDSEAMSEARYLDAVIDETLRLFPPACRHERVCSRDYPLGSTGIVIPKDAIVAIPIYAMHKDPDFFPDPETFRPERFLPENKESIIPMTFTPFGDGPRNCIGMKFALLEIKLLFMHLLKRVHFDVCPDTLIPPVGLDAFGMYVPKAVHMKVTRRVGI